MEHLQQPQERFRERASCLCLCAARDPVTNRFRIRKSLEYAFDKSVFLQNRCFEEGVSLADAAPFLQSWLWFELLEQVFRTAKVPFNQHDFIYTDTNGELCVSTEHLHRYLWYWVASESQSTAKVQTAHHKIIKRLVQEVFDVLQCFTIQEDLLHSAQIERVSVLGSYVHDDEHNTLLQVILLGEVLEHAMQVVYGVHDGSLSWDEAISSRRMLLDAGWCINEIAHLTDQFSDCHTSMLLYLASINRNLLAIDHKLCSLHECVHSEIDYNTYAPAHVNRLCHGSPVGIEDPQVWDMQDILRRGPIPMITFATETVSQDKLCLHEWQPASSESKYVAISHVWSDGLGNLHENALPRCQLARIQQSVNDLYPGSDISTPFWMDTLCVPREITVRKIAINSMRQVYGEAHRVLVLDNSLSTLNCAAMPQECLIRIKIAPWSTRLWTFHESALARRISSRLKDGALSGDEVKDMYLTVPSHGCDVVHLDQLTANGIHRHLNRALCRAMLLRNDGNGFHEVNEDDDTSSMTTTSSMEEQLERDLDLDEAFPSIHNHDTECTETVMTGQPDDDTDFGSDSANMISRNPDLAPILAEIESVADDMGEPNSDTVRIRVRLDHIRNHLLEVSTWEKLLEHDVESVKARLTSIEKWANSIDARDLEFDARMAEMRAEHEAAAGKRNLMPELVVRKRKQRRCEEALNDQIPGHWLRTRPSAADKKLRSRLYELQLGNVRPRFWLAGFDPSATEGLFAYSDLRTLTRRLETERKDTPTSGDISEAISAISFRTTSWLDDEAVCLAIILHLDVARVQACTGNARMKELASMWKSVPRGLAFAPLPRLKDDGYRWMSHSFLGTGLPNSIAGQNNASGAYRIDQGLCLKAMGILFLVTAKFDQKSQIIFTVENCSCSVSLQSIQDFRWRNLVGEQVAVVLESELDSTDLHFGVIVRCKEKDLEVLMVRFEAYVVVESCEAHRRDDDDDSHALAAGTYQLTSVEQRWCVG